MTNEVEGTYHEIEIGLAIPFPSGIFVLRTPLSQHMVETGSELPTRMMFDSSPFYLLSLLLPSVLPRSISVVMLAAGGLHPCVIIGLVRANNSLIFYIKFIPSSARRSLLIAAAIQPDSLDIVLTRLLVGIPSFDHILKL